MTKSHALQSAIESIASSEYALAQAQSQLNAANAELSAAVALSPDPDLLLNLRLHSTDFMEGTVALGFTWDGDFVPGSNFQFRGASGLWTDLSIGGVDPKVTHVVQNTTPETFIYRLLYAAEEPIYFTVTLPLE